MDVDLLISKKAILHEAFGSPLQGGGEELLYKCPSCLDDRNKKKLSVNILKNCYKCWVCGLQGRSIPNVLPMEQRRKWMEISGEKIVIADFKDLTKILLGDREPDGEERKEVECKALPENFVSLVGEESRGRAIRYLKEERGLSDKDIARWKIGLCTRGKYGGRIVVPSLDSEGEINYFVTRSYFEDAGLKYKNPRVDRNSIIFNEINIDWEEPITLVEGVFDAMKAGENAIPMLGSTLVRGSALFKKILEARVDVYVALDQDARKKQIELISRLAKEGIVAYDVCVEGDRDVGDMTKEEFQVLKRKAIRVTRDTEFNFMIRSKLRMI